MKDLQRIAERMQGAKKLDDFWTIAHEELKVYGVSGLFYGRLASASEAKTNSRYHDLPIPQGLFSKSSYSSDYLSAFGQNASLEADPTVTHCLVNDTVLAWGYNEQWAAQHPWYRQRYEAERDLGYHKGFSVPSSHFSRGWVGGLGVAMTDVPDIEFDSMWNSKQQEIIDICHLLDCGMREAHQGEFVGLAPREKEVMTWLAAGMRTQDISFKLGLSENTVANTITRAKAKLNATTRDHAVARALLLGVVEP